MYFQYLLQNVWEKLQIIYNILWPIRKNKCREKVIKFFDVSNYLEILSGGFYDKYLDNYYHEFLKKPRLA